MSSDSFDLWKKIIADQNSMFNEAISSQLRLLNQAVKQFSETNAKMLNEAISQYSKSNAQMLNEAVKQQKEFFDEMSRRQSQAFSNSIKKFDANKSLRDAAKSLGSDRPTFGKKKGRM